MKLIALHPDADAEITEAARYYESREPCLGADCSERLNHKAHLSHNERIFPSGARGQ